MTPARAATYLVGAILLAGWLASAAGVTRSQPPRAPRRSADAMQLDAVVLGVQSQASRLRKRLADAPDLLPPVRNPFTFAEHESAAAASSALLPRVAQPAPVALNGPVPDPDLTLIGVAEEGETRTAMIQSGDELLMAAEGEIVAVRYRVVKVGAEGVELVDLGTGITRRLFLRSPASLL
jgi:hypothetical protein